MQDTKAKTDINLIQFHKITSRHVLVLEADISELKDTDGFGTCMPKQRKPKTKRR